jgi:hypothetical protein
MKPYKNHDRDTGVVAYEFTKNGIYVKFKNGPVYLYTIESAGKAAISKMKECAKAGDGLTTYINQHVREHYQEKIE